MTHIVSLKCGGCKPAPLRKEQPSWWQPWMEEAEQMFSGGRYIYYEGKDPSKFRKEIIEKYEFDVFGERGWNKRHFKEFKSVGFFCPGHLYGVLYLSGIYPMGS